MRLRLSLLLLALLSTANFCPAADLLPPKTAIADAIDHYIDAELKAQTLTPASPADDATLLRRLTLDLNGRIPTLAEHRAYVGSNDPQKKLKLVDRLMASDAFTRHQVTEFDAMLATPPIGKRGSGSLRDYLTRAFKENRSWDRIFRELMLADEKDPATKGSSIFLKTRVKDLDKLTTDVSVTFFGVNISCAQCHDHPLVTDWKQDHYYGLKSFFARTFEAGQVLGERDGGAVQFKTTKNVTKTAQMMFLTGKVIDAPGSKVILPAKKDKTKLEAPTTPPKFSARAALAKLALEPEQREFFAKSIANRLWHRHFGFGLVSPIDQMHSANHPSHPELLAWLARDTAENGYDIRRLIRGIVLSKTYARSSRYESEKFPSPKTFAVARLRALTPMQLATSLRIASSDPEAFPATLKADELERKIEAIENSARSLASRLEQPRDDFQISVTEALMFSNNDAVQRELLVDTADKLLGKLKNIKNPEDAVELAAKTVLTRNITVEEKKAMVDYVATRRDRLPEAYKQMVWALLTSAEFRFNY